MFPYLPLCELLLVTGKASEEASLINKLQDHVKASTAPYKYPRMIEFVDSLPKVLCFSFIVVF